jgi:hypothetical protein
MLSRRDLVVVGGGNGERTVVELANKINGFS